MKLAIAMNSWLPKVVAEVYQGLLRPVAEALRCFTCEPSAQFIQTYITPIIMHSHSHAMRDGNKRSFSSDNCVIHGRTRYPSEQGPQPHETDVNIATSLLDFDSSESSDNAIWTPDPCTPLYHTFQAVHLPGANNAGNVKHRSRTFGNGRHGPGLSRSDSSSFSRKPTGFNPNESVNHNALEHQKNYNVMAQIYNLTKIQTIDESKFRPDPQQIPNVGTDH